MKFTSTVVAAFLACCASLATHAETERPKEDFGPEKTIQDVSHIYIQNLQGEKLGRIKDLGIDLTNGRIIEVFVVSGEFLGMGGKVVAVPPLALVTNMTKAVYYLDVTQEEFKAAPGINLKKWTDYGRSDRVTATYKHFGQEPYFLQPGEVSDRSASRPKVPLGYVQRSSKILRLPVSNLNNEKLGSVASLKLDIDHGTIGNVIVRGPGFDKTKSVISPTALSFNATHTGLLLDDTKEEFANQPQIVVTPAGNGQEASSVEEAYKGPRTSSALEQGRSYADMDRTALITRNLRSARIQGLAVKVGTLDGRITLRGTANSENDKRRAGEVAIAASSIEVVDNQLTVTAPARR
ncbi:PRC-barrel domain-containing protein [Rariglobus hedericola]|uniref:BON domain-containing protein n=1 Tax=Rariglobus hedericola TaxID=2597822 RepID=A0A556QS42_9BACT|nr:PRC-barrel domain-containing protein [Rariglobus hedericola]TSJ79442.1 BON domain-containing protein [Rariglobus hedericola]